VEGKESYCIIFRSYEQVEVFGGAGLRVERNGVPAPDEVFNAIRYLTLWALKADKSSLKSSNIRSRFLQGVSSAGDFGNGAHALMDEPTLPVPIFVSPHFLVTGVYANRLVHALRL